MYLWKKVLKKSFKNTALYFADGAAHGKEDYGRSGNGVPQAAVSGAAGTAWTSGKKEVKRILRPPNDVREYGGHQGLGIIISLMATMDANRYFP